MELLNKLISGKNLSFDEASSVMQNILKNEISDVLKASYLIALKAKGETPDEIAGFAQTMRDNSIKLNLATNSFIDVCGTGGDSSGTFNISTAVTFVAAGAGLKIAKHGNRSISSKSGSADVLKEMGVRIDLSKEETENLLDNSGIAFLFAPLYHPAMKFVASVRRELAMKTVFNMLGPLTNPAGTKKQLIGTYNLEAANKMAEAAKYLDMEKISFICTDNRFDEVTLSGNTDVITYTANEALTFENFSPADFGYPQLALSDVKGGEPVENAGILLKIFNSKSHTPHTYVACANAALAIKTAGISDNLKECVEIAEDAIFSGKALAKLEELKMVNGAL